MQVRAFVKVISLSNLVVNKYLQGYGYNNIMTKYSLQAVVRSIVRTLGWFYKQ